MCGLSTQSEGGSLKKQVIYLTIPKVLHTDIQTDRHADIQTLGRSGLSLLILLQFSLGFPIKK